MSYRRKAGTKIWLGYKHWKTRKALRHMRSKMVGGTAHIKAPHYYIIGKNDRWRKYHKYHEINAFNKKW